MAAGGNHSHCLTGGSAYNIDDINDRRYTGRIQSVYVTHQVLEFQRDGLDDGTAENPGSTVWKRRFEIRWKHTLQEHGAESGFVIVPGFVGILHRCVQLVNQVALLAVNGGALGNALDEPSQGLDLFAGR